MNLSFSKTNSHEIMMPVSPLSYRDAINFDEMHIEVQSPPAALNEDSGEAEVLVSPQEIEHLLTAARAKSVEDTEHRLRAELEAKLAEDGVRIKQALDGFITQRKQYFSSVEREVISLALAIAAKILHRESQVDPMLIGAMVRIALDKLQDSSSVSVRVPASEVERWKESMTPPPQGLKVTVIGDAQLGSNHCILQAELGTVDFSIDAQLKEVEQSFFDLLGQKPAPQ